jgi:hypothetical protein
VFGIAVHHPGPLVVEPVDKGKAHTLLITDTEEETGTDLWGIQTNAGYTVYPRLCNTSP